MNAMNAIVTTTINSPSEAIKKFAQMSDWKLYIAGDKKTPEGQWKDYEGYLSPDTQEGIDKELSDYIGWNTVSRRVMAIVKAYRDGAEVIWTVDDDNIPYENAQNKVILFGGTTALIFQSENGIFDPLSAISDKKLWHRGYPLQMVHSKNNTHLTGKITVNPVVVAGLWDGAPDVDAVCRALYPFNTRTDSDYDLPYGSFQLSPFNSQNTMIKREAIPYYYLFPKAGRMDDIFASYVLRKYFPQPVVYTEPTVYHLRNAHDLAEDMRKEIYLFDPIAVMQAAEKIDEKFCELYKKALG